ncbi:MAG: hypothetical protein NVSMB23_18160 [Myxococcales bacterium]
MARTDPEQASHPVLVVPVRIAMGQQAVQSTTRVLTAEAAFVHALARPLPGLRVGLRLYLPSGAPEDIVAIVTNRPVPTGETGFWAEFVALSASARARLEGLIASKRAAAGAVAAANPAAAPPAAGAGGRAGAPAAGPRAPPPPPRPRAPPVIIPVMEPVPRGPPLADLRSTQRIAAKLRVRFQTSAALKEEISVNISAGGMFIRTDNPPPLREMVKVAIELPGEAEPIEAHAQVVHRVTREEGRLTGRPAGAGVQFVEADDRFREALDAWLAKTTL